MARMELKTATDQEREHVVIELWMDGQALGHITLDGATAEKHMHDVAKHRANLSDPVTTDLDPGARLEAIIAPKWKVPRPPAEGRVLALRHPGLGWLAFVLPDKEVASMIELLTTDWSVQPTNK